MLSQLRIRNFVLIDQLDVEFSRGFNVLTGETGAGKSLIAAALDLLLGRRSSGEIVRREANEAEIEGIFDITDEKTVRERLEQAGLLDDDELLIRRVIPTQGRPKLYVNGRLTKVGFLTEIADELARITSQHEHHLLLEPANQLEMLDGFGELKDLVDEMSALYVKAISAQKELETLKNAERDRVQRLDYLAFQLSEIDELKPGLGELEGLERDLRRLRNVERLSRIASEARETLYEGDGSVFEQLSRALRGLEEANRHDETFKESVRQLSETQVLVEDVSGFLSSYHREIENEAEPKKLKDLEERYEALKRLERKHGRSLDEIVEFRDEITREIDTLHRYEESLEAAEKNVAQFRRVAAEHAFVLSKARRRVAHKLEKTVMRELNDLEFTSSRFELQFDSTEPEFGLKGSDRVQFMISLNLGEGLHPLKKVASGGELSRLMLAVKRALAGVGPVGTYVFDEVDSGIGGAVATAVGRKLREVSAHHQVICITHLPQIAAMAGAHFTVLKHVKNRRTTTRIKELEFDERVEEIARMLGGDQISSKTRAAAKELICHGAED